MAEEFMIYSQESPNPGTPLPSIPAPDTNRHPLKIVIISSPEGVKRTIHTLYRLGFAQVSEWSRLQPTQNPGEVMSVLFRRILID